MTRSALLIGNDSEIEATVTAVLTSPSWVTHRSSDNSAAKAFAAGNAVDLVITGPRTSGREDLALLRDIRRISPATRFIILTEKSTPADAIASMREHAFAYFTAPFTMEVFAHMVRNALEDQWDDGIEVVSATPEWICLLVRCDLKCADRVMQFMSEISQLPTAERQSVGTAFREMMLNAMEHGGHFDPNQYVEISYVHTRGMVACRVKDPGEGFSLDEIHHAAFANPPDDPIQHIRVRDEKGLRPGGFGVLMAKKLVDEVVYNEKGNEVLLVKYLSITESASAK
jgi:anti-sigma regulatory factor (Ser/Thr protein kinase)/CheY-like chemotaxis protein